MPPAISIFILEQEILENQNLILLRSTERRHHQFAVCYMILIINKLVRVSEEDGP